MKESLSYLAFGALVMGGVPLRDLPESTKANIEVAPPVQEIKKTRIHDVVVWLKSHHLAFHLRPVGIH